MVIQAIHQDIVSYEKVKLVSQKKENNFIAKVQKAYDTFSFMIGNFLSNVTAKYFSTITHYVTSPYQTKDRFLAFDKFSKIGFFNDSINKPSLEKSISEASFEITSAKNIDISKLSWFDNFVKNKPNLFEHGNLNKVKKKINSVFRRPI